MKRRYLNLLLLACILLNSGCAVFNPIGQLAETIDGGLGKIITPNPQSVTYRPGAIHDDD